MKIAPDQTLPSTESDWEVRHFRKISLFLMLAVQLGLFSVFWLAELYKDRAIYATELTVIYQKTYYFSLFALFVFLSLSHKIKSHRLFLVISIAIMSFSQIAILGILASLIPRILIESISR